MDKIGEVLVEEIRLQIRIFQEKHRKKPDYVMLHKKNKKVAVESFRELLSSKVKQNWLNVFGVRILWVKGIGKTEIICTGK